jgi:hypothetical protein
MEKFLLPSLPMLSSITRYRAKERLLDVFASWTTQFQRLRTYHPVRLSYHKGKLEETMVI